MLKSKFNLTSSRWQSAGFLVIQWARRGGRFATHDSRLTAYDRQSNEPPTRITLLNTKLRFGAFRWSSASAFTFQSIIAEISVKNDVELTVKKLRNKANSVVC